MRPFQKFPWARIVGEGGLIVVSILLAFAIDAWWEERAERVLETALLSDLQKDFEASQAHLNVWLEGNRRMLRATKHLLDQVTLAVPGTTFEVEFEWVMAAVGTPTYSPTDSTVNAALASGQLGLLMDDELRTALSSWHQQLDDTGEDENLLRGLVAGKLVPILADQVRLGRAFDFELHTAWFVGELQATSGELVVLKATLPLEAALAQRIFYQQFIVDGLDGLGEAQADILGLIERNLRD